MPRRACLPAELWRRPFTVAEAHDHGLGEGRLRSSALSRPAHGVRQMGSCETLAEMAGATRLVLPAGSAFSHLTAARLLGLPLPGRWTTSEPLDLMTVTTAPTVRRARCQGHRGLESRHVVTRKGLLVVSREDTWCDLAAAQTLNLDELIVLGDEVVHFRRGISTARLAAAVRRRQGGRGRLLMAEAFPQLRPRANSPMETRARLLFLRGGLPEPELNVVINDQDSGQWLSDSDFVWREQKVVASSTAIITAQIGSSGRMMWPGARTSKTTDGPSCS